jgi:tetratricopeptide (TPR) repeat protein
MPTNEPSSAPPSEPKIEAEGVAVAKQEAKSFPPMLNALGRFAYQRPKFLFWLVVLTTSSLTGVVAFQWLTSLAPTPNCGILFKATLSDSGQLYCADQSARRGDEASLSAALQLASSITESNPLFEQSRHLSDHWSESILVLARKKVEAGDLKKGIALAQKVPKTSAVHDNAQGMIQDWQGNWQKGDATFKKAKMAIQDQNWGQAMEQVRDLMQIGSSYWQGQADKIVKEMSVEQEAFYKIASAQNIAYSGRPEDFAKAIKAVSQIDPKRLARKRVGEKIDEWSGKLIELAKAAQANGNYAEMINAAQKVPPTAKGANVAASYLQLGRAGTASKDATLWSAIQAHAFSDQIDPTTPVYELSKTQRQKWEGQIQTWGQLAIARWFAGLDQVSGYHIAVEQAAMVSPEQPRRVEAQTLIASWTKQVSSFQDRQFMARAQQMAVENTIASLQAAMAEAGKILSGQPLRDTAQTLVAQWGGAIQRIEDQPILDQAIALAKKGELTAAIQTANKIASNRALYRDAQARAGEWIAQIQSVEDRPILNDADALASDGRLSEAIARASDIGGNRAMYGEAQSRISDWAERRRQIRAESAPPPSAAESRRTENNQTRESVAPPPKPDPEPETAPPLQNGEPPPLEPLPNDR